MWPTMASKQELLDSLQINMHLDKNFFMRVYGYNMTSPGFADEVIARLEFLGCSKARNYYTCIVAEYEHKHNEMIKRVAEWYAGQKTYTKGVNKPRKQQEVEQQRTKSQRLTDKLQLLKRKRKLLIEKQSLTVESSER